MITAHQRALEAIKSGPGNFPVGVTLAMQDEQAVGGGEPPRREARRVVYEPWLELPRGATSSASRPTRAPASARTATCLPRQASSSRRSGYEFWPEALEQTIRYAAVTREGSRLRHRERHRRPTTTRAASSTSGARSRA